jgi:mono/diheme cytochrome c family protein
LKKSKKLQARDAFVSFIRAPKMPDGSDGGMPPFPPEQLNDAQVSDLFAYVTEMIPAWK